MYSERVVDLQLNIDGIVLQRGENVEDLISKIEKITNTIYPIKWEVIQEEFYED